MAVQLDPPPDIDSNPDSFEILRLWAVSGAQRVTIRSDIGGGALGFGEMLAHLAQYGARLFAQREGTQLDPQLRAIVRGFIEEYREQGGNVEGSIPCDA
jgi:hypothetical protein